MLFGSLVVFGQDGLASELTKEKLDPFIPSAKVAWVDEYKKVVPKEKKMRYLYVLRTKGTMYGDACAMKSTRDMGFEFAIFEMNSPEVWERKYITFSNLKTKLHLLVTQGPFWKSKLKKKLKKCSGLGGDLLF